MTTTDLKSNIGDFFDALLMDGGVIITRNGKKNSLKLVREETEAKKEKSFSKELVEAIGAPARSFPARERDVVGWDMMAVRRSTEPKCTGRDWLKWNEAIHRSEY